MKRKEIKKIARGNVKRHYTLYVMICLVASVIGIAYGVSVSLFNTMVQYDIPNSQSATYDTVSGKPFTEVLDDLLDKVLQEDELKKQSTGHLGKIELGKSEGVFANFINVHAMGSPIIATVSAVSNMIMTKSADAIGICISAVFMLLVWIFFINTYHVVMARFFLEGRTYERLSVGNFLWLVKQKSFWNASATMLLKYVFLALWDLTIVGGFIKYYSYKMVPYIVAENPAIRPTQAITLSRKMMKGHKWEMFVVDLSFMGWILLDYFLTFGLLHLFYVAPYRSSTEVEYYVRFREQAKEQEIPVAEKLNDIYLYELADETLLNQYYADRINYQKIVEKGYTRKKGIAKFFADIFGVVFCYDKTEEEYSRYMEAKMKLNSCDNACEHRSYPSRLSPNASEKERKSMMESLHCIRHYSVISLTIIFFLLCFVGWSWEVALHLVSDGVFVNRGVMHGPWLPIYGAGSIMIVIVLNKFRQNFLAEFLSSIVLCGIVEFFTSLQLEKSMGQKWWDYSGYFLNIDGRICAEGLLVFGIGGMAVVYLIAPFLDNRIKNIRLKMILPICIVLLMVFFSDAVYSHYRPNTGKGITDYPTVSQKQTTPKQPDKA